MAPLRPLGPMVALTAAAMTLTPRSRAARPSSLNITCLGMLVLLLDRSLDWTGLRSGQVRYARSSRVRPLLDDGEHVLFAEDQVLLVLDLQLVTGILAEKDLVAGLAVEGVLLAVVSHLAIAHRDDLALLRLLLGAVGDDDSPLLHFLLLEPLDDDAVVQRTNLHGRRPSRCKMLTLAADPDAGTALSTHRTRLLI